MSPMSIESSEKVTHCLKKPQKMVDSVISDRICAFGFKLMNSPSIFDLLMGLLRAGLSGLVDMGGEANAVFHVDSLSLPGVSFQWQMQWFYQWVLVRARNFHIVLL